MKLARRRDNQQWILDWIVKTTGRVQNLEYDERTVPEEVKSYRMIPRHIGKHAAHLERIARAAEAAGHQATAPDVYYQAARAYHEAQHAIFADDEKRKMYYHSKLLECFDNAIATSPHPVETVEIPWEKVSIQARFHCSPDRKPRPTVVTIPGMDGCKETSGDPLGRNYLRRGLHLLAIDGPSQGISNIRKIRVTDDNYERAMKACVDYLLTRPEVDPEKIGVFGGSFGSFWALRAASHDPRLKVCGASTACYGNKVAIFEHASPRFKQVFMYMAGMRDEEEFDRMAERMTMEGYSEKVQCPTLLSIGEYDSLTYLEEAEAVFDNLAGPKEMWIFEDECHAQSDIKGLAGLNMNPFILDWMKDAFDGKYGPAHRRKVYVHANEGAGPYDAEEIRGRLL